MPLPYEQPMRRALVAIALGLSACKAQVPALTEPVSDPAWVVPTPDDPRNRRYLKPQMDRDPNRSLAALEAASKERVRHDSGFEVSPTDPRGLLEVTFRFPTGELYGLGGTVFIYLVDRPLQSRLLPYSEHHWSPWAKVWLPPGEYHVRARSGDRVPWCGVGWTPTLDPFGPAETTVTIHANETTEFQAVQLAGGRLRLTVDDGPGPHLKYAIRLIPKGGTPLPLKFFEFEDYPTRAGEFCISGSTSISRNVIPEGRYTLECEAPDEVITRTDILIGNGKVTEVHLEVPPPRNPAAWH